MDRYFTHYKNWECYKNGLYEDGFCNVKIEKSIKLLSNQELFFHTLKEILSNWPHSTKQHLTNTSINRRAYLGRAGCCFFSGANIECVREAWQSLDSKTQIKANFTANRIINIFEKKYQSNKINQLILF